MSENGKIELPLVTFALFAYNQAPFISEALDSALSQDYSPLEIVIIDDGSTDGTAEIIHAKVAEYTGPHKVKISLKDTNKGLANSVNDAIYNLSSGDWIVFAAGDDTSSNDRTSKVAALALSNLTLTLIQCGVTRVDAAGHFLGELQAPVLTLEKSVQQSILGAAAAYHRPSIASFPPIGERVIREDVVLTTRALLMGSFGRLDNSLVQWRRHENNLSGRLGKGFFQSVAFSKGRFVEAHSVAISQQVSDLTHKMMQRKIGIDDGLRLLLLFTNQIRKNCRSVDFFVALENKESLNNYLFRHPLNSAFGFAFLLYIHSKERMYFAYHKIFK
jgi:glycosyltransferase involved in cell wall biosynthesis